MKRECIILAGGLGTRLRSELPDAPKVLAPVAGHPFLYYVFQWLERNNVSRVILSLGYRSEDVISWCKSYDGSMEIVYSIESEPLGTGGAITKAMLEVRNEQVIIANGDTLFDVDLDLMERYHQNQKADVTIALKPMKHFDRYGLVRIDNDKKITGFEEKGYHEKGMINGGVYMLNKTCLNRLKLPDKFSFERDFLEKSFNQLNMFGFIQDTYFIDIGVPDDYKRAQKELSFKY